MNGFNANNVNNVNNNIEKTAKNETGKFDKKISQPSKFKTQRKNDNFVSKLVEMGFGPDKKEFNYDAWNEESERRRNEAYKKGWRPSRDGKGSDVDGFLKLKPMELKDYYLSKKGK